MNNLSLLPSGKNKIIKITSNSFLVPVQNVQKKKVDLGVKQKFTKVQKNNILKDIEKKVIRIDSLLKHSLTLRKKLAEKKRIRKSESNFELREKELEKKKPKDEDGVKSIPLPKSGGIFGWISNFIFNTILGFLAVRLIKHLPTILKIVPVISKVMDGIIDWGGKLLDGLVTFIDWGYKTYENTAKFFYKVGGEKSEKTFRDFMSKFQSMIQYSIIAGMLFSDIASSGGGGGGGGGLIDSAVDFAGEQIGKRVFQQAGRQVVQQTATTVTRTVGMTAGAAAGIVAGVGLLASALGEGSFQLRKYTKSIEKDALKKRSEAAKDKNPFTRPFKLLFFDAFAIPGMRITNFFLNGIGVTLDIIGAPFRYAIEVIRWAFMALNGDKKGMEEQRKNLGKFDARIRDGIREHFATFLGPFFRLIGKKDWASGIEKKGSWGSLFGDKAVKDMYGYAQGGPTRNSKKVDSQIQRGTGVEKKAKRTVVAKLAKLQQGSKVGGLNEIKKVFPEPQNIKSPSGTPSQTKEQTMNPFGFVSHSYYRLSSVPFLGPVLAMPLKVIMGDSIDANYYKVTGQGFNSLINKAYNEGAFSEGFSFEGNDFEKIITKSVEELSSKEMRTLNMQLMKQLMLKKIEIQNGKPSSDCPCPEPGSSGGGSSAYYGTPEQKALLDAIAFAEGTAGPNGYRTMFGHGLFNAPPWVHPNKPIPTSWGTTSTAAGRYQFLTGTWNGLGLPDFSPTNQDKGGWMLVERRGVTLSMLKQEGLSQRVADKLAPEWASFPYSPKGGRSYYGQGHKDLSKLQEAYRTSLSKNGGTSSQPPSTGINRISPSSPAGSVSDCSCDDNTPDVNDLDASEGTNAPKQSKQIVFHWNAAGGYDDTVGPYHTIFKGNGQKIQKESYDKKTPGTLYRSNAINLALAANPDIGMWPKQTQLNAMAQETANLAKAWGWSPSSINVKNVSGHGEVGSGKDVGNLSKNISTGRLPSKGPAGSQDNYGPSIWGGDGSRWDLSSLRSGQPIGEGEKEFRSLVKSKMGSAGKFGGGYVSEDGLQKIHPGEFIVDSDSVKLFGKDFMEIINQVENKTQLRSAKQSLIQMIQEIIPGYSDRSPDEIVMVPSSKTFGSKTIIDNRKYVFGNNSSDSSNPFDSLDFGN